MTNNRLATQRYGGHLILIVLALVLLVVMRVMIAGAIGGDDEKTAVSTNASDTTDDSELGSLANEPGEPITHTEELPIIEDTSLSPALNPYTYQPKLPEHTFQTYTVQRGDTPNKSPNASASSRKPCWAATPSSARNRICCNPMPS